MPIGLMKTRPVRSSLLLAIALTSAACSDLLVPDPTFVAVTEIEVTNEDDSGTLLEIEVHLYDARSGFFLGCSGEADGLGHVDESDVAYLTTAYFGAAGGDLTVEELEGMDLYAVVVEDDDEPCPVPTNEGSFDLVTDDLIGVSPIFRGEDLHGGIGFGFDDVVWLALEGIR